MPSMYEVIHTTGHQTEGHEAWVETREKLPGGKVAASIRKAKPPADHDYDDCSHPYRCKAHRSTYDRKRRAVKRQQAESQRHHEALERDAEVQRQLQHQRAVRRMASASTR